MTTLTLFGTVTSPFVRRVRIVAMEAGVPIELVDTATDEGKARLYATSPVGKVPTGVLDGAVLWDSANLVDALVARADTEVLRPLPTSVLARARAMNVVHAIDEATLSAIRLFYLDRDAVPRTGPFLERESLRVDAVLAALEADAKSTFAPEAPLLGRAELALVTGIDWMRLRNRIELARYPALTAITATLGERPSVRATSPF